MGVWGMGLTQSDTFCEVYDNFMHQYNNGAEVADITATILSKYHNEFNETDGILHDVYFALAKAEWICCEQSDLILNKVKSIIETNVNITFYRELDTTESDLKLRRRNLEKFWVSLQTPRAKPRQRRIDSLDREKELPPIQPGDCYAYKFDTGYRIMVILDRFKEEGWLEQVCCCILSGTFSSFDIDVTKEEIGHIALYIGLEFIAKSKLRKLSSISIPENLRKCIPQECIAWHGKKADFTQEKFTPLKHTVADLLHNAG